jgi:GNAT superfamily N-acetyltransferase
VNGGARPGGGEAAIASVTIRRATLADAAAVLSFIRELADYERLLHEVKTTQADVEALLFGPAPRAFCEIAETADGPAGFALWFYSVSTFEGRHGLYLEDLYVRPAFRGAGIGGALLARLARRCVEEDLARMEWSVLDWNAPAIAFYDSLGAAVKREWITRRLTGEALSRLAGG